MGEPNKAVWNIVSVLKNTSSSTYVLGNGTTAGKVNITVPLNDQDIAFYIDGLQYQKAPGAGTAIIADAFSCTALTDLAANEYCKVLCLYNSSGTGSIVQGTIKTSQALAPLPDIPAGYSAIGYLEAGDAGGVDWDDAGGMAAQGVAYVEGYSLSN